jgi:hypothetical protein
VKIVPPTPVPVMLGGVVEQILRGLERLSYLNALLFGAEQKGIRLMLVVH